MVKTIKVWKLNFYKNDDENGGAMNEAIKTQKENEIVIHSQTQKNGRLWGSVSSLALLKLLEKNYGLYEVITQFPHKMYFDIDKKGKQDDTFLTDIKNKIIKYFPDAKMAISGSIKETKTSYHIVLQNYTIHNEAEREHIKYLVKYMCECEDESFDWKVYTKNRNMKCINQSKDDGRIQEIIENIDFKTHCITCFINDYVLPFQPLPESIKEEIFINKAKTPFDIGTLPKLILTLPENFDSTNATSSEILGLLPLNKNYDHSYTHLVARYCYYNKITFETYLSWLEKKHNPLTQPIISKWKTHWNRIDKFPNVEHNKIIGILQHFYPHIKKDIHYRNFSQTFQLPTDKIEMIETINQSCFNNETKYNLFNVGMGGGKTAQTITYLKSELSFIWIAPNKALANNTLKRMEDEDVDVAYYANYKSQNKKEGCLKEINKLIICLNSIHYLKDQNYNVIVIDEIETLLNKFEGDFLEQNEQQFKKLIWETFIELFKRADKVILLDAFITSKTINFIKEIEGNIDNIVIFQRKNEPQTRTIKYLKNETAMIADIIQKIKEGSKLFIFYPYKNNTGLHYSMTQIYETIKKETGKDGIFYNADVADKTKQELKDVNNSWKDRGFIITNNIITCGVNYENLDFDYKYIFVASHNSPRDIIQVSYRVRYLNSGIIKLCYYGKMNQKNTWLNDCDKMACPIYKKLYQDILIEQKAPIKKSIQLFCVKAHYKHEVDDFTINDKVESEIKELLNNNYVMMTYKNIDIISEADAKHIKEQCFAQQATMMEKFELNKFYFRKSFLDNQNNEKVLASIWDDNYVGVLQRIGTILKNQNNIFNQIAEHNQLEFLFPVNIKKTKLTEKHKEQIFNEFTFKFISSGSSSHKILKEIYNTYFSKFIITTKIDANNNINYFIDENVYKYYDFAKENLILDKKTYLTYKEYYGSQNVEDAVEV